MQPGSVGDTSTVSTISALVADFCTYYAPHPNKTVIYYYDATALGSNYAVNDQDFHWVVVHEFERHGWQVIDVYLGNPMRHDEKYLLINQGFAGKQRLMPYFNRQNNDDLILAIQSAGVERGRNGFRKNKSMEKQPESEEDLLEHRTPTPDNTYYPIPYYAALFKGKWFNIKQLIGIAKEAKLRNSAPIKYHIEIANSFWNNIFKVEGITDRVKQQERVNEEKDNIINFLTGMENSGKVLFSTFYVSPNGEEQPDVVINKIETDKEGGDWATDIVEAINMMCFTMRVHSNLVGSVPGKSQSNNSGSDKRELYTIAQALQKPYHDLIFSVHRLIIRFNKWTAVKPDCSFIQLTTLDENKDAKQVSLNKSKDNGNADK